MTTSAAPAEPPDVRSVELAGDHPFPCRYGCLANDLVGTVEVIE